jgi:hypothetical protein
MVTNISEHISSKEREQYGFEILTAAVMNIAIIWDIAPCSSYVNRRFGGTCNLHLGSHLLHSGFLLG